MKPGYALSLSFEGISLLQRAAGGWRLVGEVAVDSPDLVGDLKRLRDKTGASGSDKLRCKVIIPNDQVRYVAVETGSFDGEARLAMVRHALEGATPYPVDDLAYDISVDGSTTYVAAVVRDTLVEAEDFAVQHGFNPLCFVAAPGDNPYLGEPYFGASAHASSLSALGEVEPDGVAVVVIGPVDLPGAGPQPEPEPQTEATPEPGPAPVSGGFSSRRAKATAARHASGTVIAAPDGVPPDSPARDESDPVVFRSAKAKADDAARMSARDPAPRADEQVSVIAPTLEIPEPAGPEPEPGPESETAEAQTSRLGAFLSRRKSSERIEPVLPASGDTLTAYPAAAAIPAAPPLDGPVHEPANRPELTAISRPDGAALASAGNFARPDDEAARMTVFGARGQAKVGGKPRHLGLILSAALLVFLAAIAAWATIFLEDGVAGLFRGTTAPATELVGVPDTPAIGVRADNPAAGPDSRPGKASVPTLGEAPGAPVGERVPATRAPVTSALLPPADIDLPSLPAPRRLVRPAQPVPPVPPALTDTDSAVLDALRQPRSDDNPPAPPAQTAPQAGPAARDDAAGTTARQLLDTAPQVPATPSIIGLDDLYVASIDRTDLSQDAVALPKVAMLDTDLPPGAVSSPVASGTAFDLDAAGLVVATPGGRLNPDGIMVFLGRPAVVPPPRPSRPDARPGADPGNVRLAGLRPLARPGDLEERFERDNLGGLTRAELGGLRPKARPNSNQQDNDPEPAPTAQAVVASTPPRSRPGNIAAIARAAIRLPPADDATGGQAAPVTPVAPATVTPSIPSSASVARQATLRNEINLRRVNLIGVYGSPSNRRALVRLPSGRYKKVKVGDTVDGGRVVAIGDSELRYQKSGRSLTLKIPSS